jgi:hypothetical protein
MVAPVRSTMCQKLATIRGLRKPDGERITTSAPATNIARLQKIADATWNIGKPLTMTSLTVTPAAQALP